MRVKEWHKIMVKGKPVFHDLEPAYYRQGKTNVRINGIWYCAECDDVVNMRLLTKQGINRKPSLSGKYTSMFEKGLRLEEKTRLPEQEVKGISNVEKSLPEESDSEVSPRVEPEKNHIMPFQSKEKYPGTARSAKCPCGSGRKYKRCCGANI